MMKRLLFILFFLVVSVSPSFPVVSGNEAVVLSEAVEEVVYVTKSGKKFHKSSCHYLKKSRIKTSRSKAVRSGYTACKVCKP